MGFMEVFAFDRQMKAVYGERDDNRGAAMLQIEYLLDKIVSIELRSILLALKPKYNIQSLINQEEDPMTSEYVYSGMSADDTILTSGDVSSLNETQGEQVGLILPIQGTQEYIYFATPQIFGPITDILDGNGFSVYDSGDPNPIFFLNTTLVTTPDGTAMYNIYRTKIPTTVSTLQNFIVSFSNL